MLTSSQSIIDSVMACLLKNEPASYLMVQLKAVIAGGTGKPSLNRALLYHEIDPNLGDLTMASVKRK